MGHTLAKEWRWSPLLSLFPFRRRTAALAAVILMAAALAALAAPAALAPFVGPRRANTVFHSGPGGNGGTAAPAASLDETRPRGEADPARLRGGDGGGGSGAALLSDMPLLPPTEPPPAPVYPDAAAEAPPVRARAAVLIDFDTGMVLYERNMHRRLHPASTTKVMTAILALEYGLLDEEAAVSRRAAGTPGSSMGIRAGETYTVAELLRGILLPSGNDAAVALAEHISGTEEHFAELMNDKVGQLGLRNSHFLNSHGLTRQGHYASAYDLAMLTRYAYGLPNFRDVVCLRSDRVCSQDGRALTLHNTNRLLWFHDFVDGGKTGTTSAAGPCLIVSGSREGHRLIAVVLNSSNRWNEAGALLDWGFETFRPVSFAARGGVIGRIPLTGGFAEELPYTAAEDLVIPVPRRARDTRVEIDVPPGASAPVRAGQQLGFYRVLVDGQPAASVPLVAARGAAAYSWPGALLRALTPGLDLVGPGGPGGGRPGQDR